MATTFALTALAAPGLWPAHADTGHRPAGAPPAAGPRVTEERGVEDAVARAAADRIRFHSCAAAEKLSAPARCGTVSVPLDYAHPRGRQLKLDVSRQRATGPKAKRKGALVFNPGGPGGSGMYFPRLSTRPGWTKVAKAYDFIGYAPRGVERSGRLSCQNPKKFMAGPHNEAQFPTETEKATRIKEAQTYAQGCAKNRGLRFYTSLNNVRDLEVLRAALGRKRLDFMGASYGTYLGAMYAALYPGHVGRLVLDSAVDPRPEQIWYENNLVQSLAFESRWRDWRKWTAAHDATYHLGRTAAQVGKAYDKARRSIEARPAGGKVGTREMQAAFLKAGYADDFWPYASTALSDYLAGKEQAMVDFAAVDPASYASEENGNAVYTAVECNDSPWPADWQVWDEDNTALAVRAPFETWDNVWMNLPCAYWPAPHLNPVDIRTAPGQLPPVLILSAERDAATPHAGAVELHRRLPGSTLVTERGAGSHGIAGGPNRCVNRIVDTYLLTGRTPGDTADCKARRAPKAEHKTMAKSA
jgi:pimeloyl-ACP methyl ester carboxylesterase